MREEIPEPVKVEYEELTPSPEIIPNEHSDWADMNANTQLTIQDEYEFDVRGIAVLGEKYEYDYYVGANINITSLQRKQKSLDGYLEKSETNENGIVESTDSSFDTYSLESRIGALAHTMLTDGYTHGLKMVDSKEDIRVEYAEHPSMDRYIVQIFWKR